MRRRTFFKSTIAGGAILSGAHNMYVKSAFAQQSKRLSGKYDTLLKGGHVIDPANNINGKMDIAILDGKIASVEKNIPASSVKMELDDEGAIKVIDVSGLYVTPGLIDIHIHTNYPNGDVNPRDICFKSGVTTAVCAGSVGAYKVGEMIDLFYGPDAGFYSGGFYTPRVLVLLNMSAIGTGVSGKNEPSQLNVPYAIETAQKYPDIIVGIKCFSQPDFKGDVWLGVEKSEEVTRLTGMPVMYDFQELKAENGHPARTYPELISRRMAPGNIHTHCFAPQFPVILENGEVNPILIKARERGVIFDVGHGSGSLVFRNAIPAIDQGFLPDSISTDLHGLNTNSPVISMTNVMSKFLSIGMSFEDVIRCSTVNPARQIKRADLGTLSVGATADIAVIDLLKGNFTFTDCSPKQDLTGGARIKGKNKLESVLTIFGGNIVSDPTGLTYRYIEDIPKTDEYWGNRLG